MNPDRWKRVQDLFARALEVEPSDRAAFLAGESEDEGVRREVEAMLTGDDQESGFMEGGALGHEVAGELWKHKSKILEEDAGTSSTTLGLDLRSSRDLIGRTVGGRYRIDDILGQGGMGTVFKATQLNLKRTVALKVVRGDFAAQEGAGDRFEREALAIAKLKDPNIVTIYDFGVEREIGAYLVMEMLHGTSLRKEMDARQGFPPMDAVGLMRQVCSAVYAAHRVGIVHRDLKPANIFLEATHQGVLVKVLDFGIAKLADLEGPTGGLTESGVLIGTPAYMSPEQCRETSTDGRSDIYSLGVILFEMLACRLPFESKNTVGFVHGHVYEAPPVLHDIAAEVPKGLSDVVMRMLAKSPGDRYETTMEVSSALSAAMGIPSGIGTDAGPMGRLSGHAAPHSRPGRRVYLAVALAALALLAAGLVMKLPDRAITTTGTSTSTQPVRTGADAGPGFVLIPGGVVTIGQDPKACQGVVYCKVSVDETPPHTVTLEPYYISSFEVTNREYQEFVVGDRHRPPQAWRGGTYPIGTESYPVTDVSWEDATAYCAWRSRRDGVELRLATEAEWEFAARGSDARLFPWGDAWNETFANADRAEGSGSPLPVDRAPNNTSDVSVFGVYAMAGNVSEWTNSKFEVYPGGAYTPSPHDQRSRVFRGGYFSAVPNALRTTFRAWDLPTYTAPYLGFRLASTLRK